MNRNFVFVGLQFDLETRSTVTVTRSKNFFNCEDYCMNQIRETVKLGETPTEYYIAQRFGEVDRVIQRIRYNGTEIECLYAEEVDDDIEYFGVDND